MPELKATRPDKDHSMEHQRQSPEGKPKGRELTMAKVEHVKNPVWGMMVDPLNAARTYTHHEPTYYLCSTPCGKRFSSDPEGFLKGKYQPSMESHGATGTATSLLHAGA
jgi:YHS domain-containing protein